jgi:hypothetical protein
VEPPRRVAYCSAGRARCACTHALSTHGGWMKHIGRLTWITLGTVLVVVLAVVMREAMSGPVFRAADYDSVQECIANIPREWLPGSLDHSGAESACHYVHQRRSRQ